MVLKKCARCGQEKDIESFSLPRREYCRPCNNSRIAQWREKKKRERAALEGPKPPQTHKQCAVCLETKELDQFYVSQSGKKWRSSYCKPCCSVLVAARRLKNPGKRREYDLRWRTKSFGTTVEWFHEKLAEQHGVCAICNMPETDVYRATGKRKALAIDHDHDTGRVRGLLCTKCNQSLFLLEKHTDWTVKAVHYLELYK